MKLHLSHKSGELLEFLDKQIFPKWNQRAESGDTDPRLVRAMKRIEASRREFDARLFFIVVFGPLKSGKSTLVNTLARQYVSPTRFARESTRRSSIVIKGEKSGIQQYFWRHDHPDAPDTERKDAFERVIQYLRGVLTMEALQPDVEVVETSYDRQTVDRVLAGPLEREPLITVIRCPGGRLIGEEISVLDVPGLDGFQTNTENNPAAFWIIDKSDLLIFTQSSFAPLNNQTSRYLRDLYEGSRKPPVLLVQNQIEARHWADPLEQQKDTDEQVMVARKEISDLLGISGTQLPAWPINLGKAHDGFFKELPELMDDSKFETFESELQKYLESSRMELHEKNCLNEMAGEVADAEKAIESIIEEMDSRLKKEQVNLALLRQCRENLQNLSYQTRWLEHDFNEIENQWFAPRMAKAGEYIASECRSIADELHQTIPRQKVRGRVINQLIMTHSERILSKVRSDILAADEDLRSRLERCFSEAAQHLESNVLRETAMTLGELGLEPLTIPESFPLSDLPGLPGNGLDFDTYEERTRLLGFIPWPRKYPKGAIEEAIRKDLAAQWNQALEELSQKWINQMKDFFVSSCADSRQRPWIETMESHILEQTRKHHKAKEHITERNEALDELHTQVTAIKNRLHATAPE
jgi:GTPase SAR1 family protein